MSLREEILEEIKKYAEEIGKTPSEKRFYEHTDFGINDLKKGGWVNYGELVRGAELTPNKFDNTKYNKEQLCKLFIEVMQEKGKWPTRGILDVKHHTTTNFPEASTFYKRLGLTGELVKSILDFTKDKQGYDDVNKICKTVLEEFEVQDESLEEGNLISGFVYLGKQHGDYKIGKTTDMNRRREDITLLGSEPFEIECVLNTDDMNGIEQYWQNRFSNKHRRGEWFKLSRQDVKAFKRWERIY